LDHETLVAVREGIAQAERGEFATEEEIEEIFGRYRAAPKDKTNSSL
jgi:predicted transcriptional regulator